MSLETECERKVRYLTRSKAKHATRQIRSRTRKLHAYRCSYCGFWHVGRKRPALRAAA